jgi:hypothetical protein
MNPGETRSTVADFDGDGFLGRASGTLFTGHEIVLEIGFGSSTGGSETVSYSVPANGQYVEHLMAADLNGDDLLDLTGVNIHSPGNGGFDTSAFFILLNDGSRAFHYEPSLNASLDVGTPLIADLDGDGFLDLAATGSRGVSVLLNRTIAPRSRDSNHNGIPDECETRFHRGDPNSSGMTDISDAIAIFGYLFLGEPATLSCLESANTNNDATIDISDGISLLNWLFIGGATPAAPGPTDMPCGVDPDPTGSPGDLGCADYPPCP